MPLVERRSRLCLWGLARCKSIGFGFILNEFNAIKKDINMQLRMCKCTWCGKEYALKDSKSSSPSVHCSRACDDEYSNARKEYKKWDEEISDAWSKYTDDYVPEDDEEMPCLCFSVSWADPVSRREFEAFRRHYHAWKHNHCWKKSFWDWNESSPSSFSGGSGRGDGGSSGSGGGIGKTILNLIIVVVVIWLGWKGGKGVWNMVFSGGDEVDVMATITESWEKHLEQRREAFEDGLPEKEVEAKGLRNYTLAEWEEKCLKEQEAKKQAEMKKKAEQGEEVSATQKAKEIGKEALSTVKGLGSKAKGFLHKITE